jgi:hypothetical protein
MEREAIDTVLGLYVHRFSVGISEDAADRSRDHAVAVGIAKDDHAPPDDGVADEETVVHATDAYCGSLTPMVADLPRSHVRHGSLGPLLAI